MRSEQEMFETILRLAREEERIRAVYMNGSRANPNVPRDLYQDYDIVYVVTETKPFLADRGWLAPLGEIAVCQEPDGNDAALGKPVHPERSYTWLMLFKDGNRIDLHIQTREVLAEEYGKDKLTVPLLDKDGLLPELPPPSDEDYRVLRPSEAEYLACCNEFWWCLNNMAKGIARDQLPYVMWMYHVIVRDMLHKMLDWYIGVRTEFRVNVGMSGKYYRKYLPQHLYEQYARTYSGSEYDAVWASVFTACGLFRTVAAAVGDALGYPYNREEDENMTAYLSRMQDDSCRMQEDAGRMREEAGRMRGDACRMQEEAGRMREDDPRVEAAEAAPILRKEPNR